MEFLLTKNPSNIIIGPIIVNNNRRKTMQDDFFTKPHCSVSVSPTPTVLDCPNCREEVEVWSDEDAAVCPSCGREVCKPQ